MVSAIRQTLAAKDPSNTRWQRDPSVSNDKIGDVLVKQDKLDDALASYKVSLAIAHALAAWRHKRASLRQTSTVCGAFDLMRRRVPLHQFRFIQQSHVVVATYPALEQSPEPRWRSAQPGPHNLIDLNGHRCREQNAADAGGGDR
jgi:hypothetical protein